MTEEEIRDSESKKNQAEMERQFDQAQYDRLMDCSKKGPEGIAEWNRWKKENPHEPLRLQGADLSNAKLQGAVLSYARLQGADLHRADLQGAGFFAANLKDADLKAADLKGAYLLSSDLQAADFFGADLQGAHFGGANLKAAVLRSANLQGAILTYANLQGATFMDAIVNASTSFLNCEVDRDTDFRNTALEDMLIDSRTKILLKHNVQRMNWQDWYAKHRILQWPAKVFWGISNFGISAWRIVLSFLIQRR